MSSSQPDLSAMHILVVEDVLEDFELMEHELKDAGLRFSSVRIDGPDELSQELNRQEPDIVLCDHGHARFDSFSVLEVVRARSQALPFVVVTGSLAEAQAAEALARGADEIVHKHRLAELGPAVQRALRLGEIRRRLAVAEQERDRLRAEMEAWRYGRPRLPTVVPICAGCKKIHTPADDWETLEKHFREHFNIRFSHGICPGCTAKYSTGPA